MMIYPQDHLCFLFKLEKIGYVHSVLIKILSKNGSLRVEEKISENRYMPFKQGKLWMFKLNGSARKGKE